MKTNRTLDRHLPAFATRLAGANHCSPRGAQARGFTLVEVAISLLLLGLAAVGVFAVLTQQIEQHRISDTKATLLKANDALLSYVTTNGRLPCPAVAGTQGQEAIASSGGGVVTCTSQTGFVPAVTLGMPNVDAWGLLEGAWNDGAGSTNGTYLRAIRYAVTSLGGTTASALTSVSLGGLPGNSTQRIAVQNALVANQGLFVCSSITGILPAGNRCGNQANTLAANVAVILWSLGSDADDLINYSADEKQNLNWTVPRVVISRTYAPRGAINGQFDDLVSWIAYPVIADRLVTTGFVQ